MWRFLLALLALCSSLSSVHGGTERLSGGNGQIVFASDGNFTPDPPDYFGSAIDMTSDEETMIVCSPSDDGPVDAIKAQGSCYIWVQSPPSSGTWVEDAKIEASDACFECFFGYEGEGAAIENTASSIIAVVGAIGNDLWSGNAGTAYFFHFVSPGVWTEDLLVPVSNPGFISGFGCAIAISGPLVFIGTYGYSIHVYKETTLGSYDWQPYGAIANPVDRTSSDYFGEFLKVSGNNILIGAYQDNDLGSSAGAAWLYTETIPGTFDEVTQLVALDTMSGDRYGSSGDVSDTLICVGAFIKAEGGNQRGAAYVFSESSPGVWTEEVKLIQDVPFNFNNFGRSISIVSTHIAISAAGYCWDVDIGGCADGATNNDGRIYFYSQIGYRDWIMNNMVFSSDGQTDIYFSGSGAIRIYGSTLVVGAPSGDGVTERSGVSYIYDLDFIDDCPGHACQNGATCRDGYHDYECICPPMFSGTYCEICACQNGGACTEEPVGNWFCDCDGLNFYGVLCDNACANGVGDASTTFASCDCTGTSTYGISCENECLNGGTDVSPFDACDCSGTSAYGSACESVCLNGGVPAVSLDKCDCSLVHAVGATCDKSCNNGKTDAEFTTCNCTGSGATGKFCTEDVDDCASDPCMHGGTCTDYGADLFPNHNNEFNCTCDGTGYVGDVCEIEILVCESSPCQNEGVCLETENILNDPNVNGFMCNCTGTGYKGEVCEIEFDECTSSPCVNGVCNDLLSNFTCDCTASGFEGALCTRDVDDCASMPCMNGASCKDKGTFKFKCTCEVGFEGDVCEINVIDECASSPCFHGGLCIDEENMFACDCVGTGFEGSFCESNIDECLSAPCFTAGATCVDDIAGYTCLEPAPSPCDSNPCTAPKECEHMVSDQTNTTGNYTCVGPVAVSYVALTCDNTVVDCKDEQAIETWVVSVLIQDIGGIPADYNVTVIAYGNDKLEYDVDIVYNDPENNFVDDAEFAELIEQQSPVYRIQSAATWTSSESSAAIPHVCYSTTIILLMYIYTATLLL